MFFPYGCGGPAAETIATVTWVCSQNPHLIFSCGFPVVSAEISGSMLCVVHIFHEDLHVIVSASPLSVWS